MVHAQEWLDMEVMTIIIAKYIYLSTEFQLFLQAAQTDFPNHYCGC